MVDLHIKMLEIYCDFLKIDHLKIFYSTISFRCFTEIVPVACFVLLRSVCCGGGGGAKVYASSKVQVKSRVLFCVCESDTPQRCCC